MRSQSLPISLTVIVCVALAIWTATSKPTRTSSESGNVVVVRGTQPAPIGPSRPTAVGGAAQGAPLSENRPSPALTLTEKEVEEIGSIAELAATEERDERWASDNESRLSTRLRELGIFDNSRSTIICASTRCALTTRTNGKASAYNGDLALNELRSLSGSAVTSKVFSVKGRLGETVYKVELIRN